MKTLLLLLSLTLISCTPPTSSFDKKAKDLGFVTNQFNEALMWKKYPITLTISKSVPQEFYQDLESSIQAWNEAAQKTLFILDTTSISDSHMPTKDQKNIIYFLSSWEEDRPGEQGRATLYWEGFEIKEADIRINIKDFTYFSKNSKPLTGEKVVQINSLLIHELGHVLGLSHIDSHPSVMNPYLPSGTIRDQFSKRDYSFINFLSSL